MPANAPTGAATPTQQLSAGASGGVGGGSGVAAANKPAQSAASPMPPIPPDARLTIFCYAVKGPGHVENALTTREALIRKTGRGDWYVIHGQNESNIYFGFYPPLESGKNAAAAPICR